MPHDTACISRNISRGSRRRRRRGRACLAELDFATRENVSEANAMHLLCMSKLNLRL